ncbi:MAG: twin-arginine translocase TatA/TatE family subunit [Rickettsiaceae bacterium]|jgi:Sec-independent protein translocase protein TatA|nr:twin-arginine translocase TatA/TatE family subunit [Rickettsiaceae bacterium]
MNFGLPEIILILLILTIMFGGKRMTDLAREAGNTGRELKKIKKEYGEAKEEVDKIKSEGGAANV